jgi:hypothetical protein
VYDTRGDHHGGILNENTGWRLGNNPGRSSLDWIVLVVRMEGMEVSRCETESWDRTRGHRPSRSVDVYSSGSSRVEKMSVLVKRAYAQSATTEKHLQSNKKKKNNTASNRIQRSY